MQLKKARKYIRNHHQRKKEILTEMEEEVAIITMTRETIKGKCSLEITTLINPRKSPYLKLQWRKDPYADFTRRESVKRGVIVHSTMRKCQRNQNSANTI